MLLLLPLLNAATTHVHLLTTLGTGDWERAGVDLFALASGMALLAVWRRLPHAAARTSLCKRQSGVHRW